MDRYESKRKQSINKLVGTALRLFSEYGYEPTSIRMIAKEAGLSLGLMYNYFKSKEELLLEIFRRSSEDIHTSLEEKKPDDSSAKSGVERHIQQTVKLLKEKREFWKLLHGLRMQSPVVQTLLPEIQAQTSFIEEKIKSNLIEAGIPFPDLEAKLLFASIDGMASHFLLYDNYPIDDVASLLAMKYKKH